MRIVGYKQLIINEIFVEATGVELIRVLTTRKLLIRGTATTAKKAPLPNPLYVYCTKMLFALESKGDTKRPQYPVERRELVDTCRDRNRAGGE